MAQQFTAGETIMVKEHYSSEFREKVFVGLFRKTGSGWHTGYKADEKGTYVGYRDAARIRQCGRCEGTGSVKSDWSDPDATFPLTNRPTLCETCKGSGEVDYATQYVDHVVNAKNHVMSVASYAATVLPAMQAKAEAEQAAAQARAIRQSTLLGQIVDAAQNAEDPMLAVARLVRNNSWVSSPRGHLVAQSDLYRAADRYFESSGHSRYDEKAS